MKYRGKVISVEDNGNLGRIKIRVIGFDHGRDIVYAWPSMPMAGPGYGFMFSPKEGDDVFIEKDATNRWVCTGYFWAQEGDRPVYGHADIRAIRTPAGHQITLDDNGDVVIKHQNGASISLKDSGEIIIGAGSQPAVLGNSLNEALSEIVSTFNSHTHKSGSSGSPTSPPNSDMEEGKFLSKKVKVE